MSFVAEAHLAEDGVGMIDLEQHLVTGGRDGGQLHQAGPDLEQRIRRVAGVEDTFTAPGPDVRCR